MKGLLGKNLNMYLPDMKTINSAGYNLFCIGLFMLMLYSMQVWFSMLENVYINNLPFLFIICSVFHKGLWDASKSKISLAIVYLFVWVLTRDFDEEILKVRYTLPIILVILLRNEYYGRLIISISKMFAVILIPAIFLHLLILFISIPPFGLFSTPQYGVYANYIFNIHSLDVYSERFNACFCEPGHLGMIMSFLLYVNKYQVRKWYVMVCLASLLLSLSLAGYVLLLLGYLFYSLCRSSVTRSIGYLFFGGIISIIVYFISTNYNGGHNYVNEKIIERLEYDEDRGSIKGDNRVSPATDAFFKSSDLSDFIVGMRSSKMMQDWNLRGSGYKIFIMEYGIVSLVLVFLLYFFITKRAAKVRRRYCYGLLLLYCAAFIQRSYPFWASWLIPFICFCMDNAYLKRIKNSIATK